MRNHPTNHPGGKSPTAPGIPAWAWLLLWLACGPLVAAAAGPNLVLWYAQPAARWEEAIPLGNGRLGAMLFGGVTNEHLQLNEDTLVSDGPDYRNLPLNVRKEFAQVTNLIGQRKSTEAERVVNEKWLGRAQACYQPLGDLYLDLAHTGAPSKYRRELDLAQAAAKVSYEVDGVTFTREIIASHPDEVLALRLTASKPGALEFRLRMESPHPARRQAEGNRLILTGQVPGFALRRTLETVEKKQETWKYPELFDATGKRLPQAATVLYGTNCSGKGLYFAAQAAISSDGQVTAEAGALRVRGASAALIVYSAASSYRGFGQAPGPDASEALARSGRWVTEAGQRDFAALRARHVQDYRQLFDRVTFDLQTGEPAVSLPTNERLKQFARQPDWHLAELYFQFGRYLMISGSRPGTQPLNLQGIWNREVIPPWASQYTININTEMNYWPAEPCNLSECHEPLLRMVRELAVDGARVAREMYQARGWVAHHNTTLWRDAQPVDGAAVASFWPMAAGWLCQHLYEHYRFTADRDYLRREAYPLMKGACEFYLDWLVPDAQGRLVTPVSSSPENTFTYLNEAGQKQRGCLSAGSTMDMAIIRDVFQNTLEAAGILQQDAAFQAELKEKLARLLPFQIGRNGRLQEWAEDFADAEPTHRHVSHLLALHPGRQIGVRTTPELAAAARRTLELRGDGGTGWSKAWKVNFWARLEDGNHAAKMLEELIAKSTLPNFFDTHPPFQIDGNFGGLAGMTEMLLQSHLDELHLLPALPAAWPQGRITGLRARGGFEVEIAWQQGRLARAVIRSHAGAPCTVRCAGKTVTFPTVAGRAYALDEQLKTP